MLRWSILQAKKIMPARPVSGNKNLLVSLSSASKMPLPMIVKSLHKLNDNSAAIPNSQITVLAAIVDIVRFIDVRSSKNSTLGSSSDIDDVTAAKVINKKNKVPIIVPPAMLPKAIGRLTKIKPGPDAGSRPLLKMIGKMAKPAAKAITVSKITTVRAVFSKFTSRPKYEP